MAVGSVDSSVAQAEAWRGAGLISSVPRAASAPAPANASTVTGSLDFPSACDSSNQRRDTGGMGGGCSQGGISTPMVQLSTKSTQVLSMFFSSWVLIFLSLGIMVDNWVTLNFETQANTQSHSPWIHTTIWPKDDLKVVRTMMILVVSFSFFHNIFLGLEFTFMIPQTQCILLTTVLLSFSTGALLLCALLLYHLRLRRGLAKYYSGYKVTWVISTAYLSVCFLFASGILCLLQYKQLMNPARESPAAQQSSSYTQVTALPQCTAKPRSIVRIHSENSGQGSPEKPETQKRRVTWAL